MCYASPGPRCEGHAKERFQKINDKASRKFNALMAVSREKEQVEENPEAVGSAAHTRLKKRHETLKEETQALIKKRQEARDEMDATSGGLDTLRQKLDLIPATAETRDDRKRLMRRIEAGRTTYQAKMLDYDKEHGTVNGRKPSNYGTMEGMKKLRERTVKCRTAYLNAKTNEEKNAAWEKYQTADKAFVHARDTFDRKQKGLLSAAKPKELTPEDKYNQAKTEFEKADTEYREVSKKRERVFQNIVNLEIEEASHGRIATTYSPNNPRSYTRKAAEDNNRWIDEDIALGKVVDKLSNKRSDLRRRMKEAEAEKDKVNS